MSLEDKDKQLKKTSDSKSKWRFFGGVMYIPEEEQEKNFAKSIEVLFESVEQQPVDSNSTFDKFLKELKEA